MAISFALPVAASADTQTLIISGLGGEPQYEQRFADQAAALAKSAEKLTGNKANVTLLSGEKATRDAVRREIRALATRAAADDQLIIVLIGHASFDGEEYRLNLPGPDLTASELATALDQLGPQEQLIVNATSASGAVVDRWKRDKRVLITATKNGGERTATRFPEYWMEAVTTAAADVNKDDVVTAQEAFDFATRKVADMYKSNASLATEHARLEGRGAERIHVARFGAATMFTTNAQLSEMFAQRLQIERELEAVRNRRQELAQDAYYDELQAVLVKLAKLQRDIDTRQAAINSQQSQTR